MDPAVPPPAPSASPPHLPRISPGRFHSFVPLGQGGMGIVYKAFDTLLARDVAFKVARPDGGRGGSFVTPPSPLALHPAADGSSAPALAEARARFINEACLTGGIEHPSIAPVYDVGETEEGLPYYTMRLIPGHRTLADAIADAVIDGPGARLALLEPIVKVCDAVAYAHAKGILHRDLKPQNVALGEFGEVVVLDWGLAKAHAATGVALDDGRSRLLDVREALALRTVPSLLGTPGWLAPEALAGGPGAIDEKSDVFALGVILFEALTGRLPWPADDVTGYSAAVARGPAPRASEIDTTVPVALSDLVDRAIALEPMRRLASAAELSQGIRSWQVRSSADREREVRLTEARAALAVAMELPGGPSLPHLDRAAAQLEALRVLLPADPERESLARRLGEMRIEASTELTIVARRRTRRRATAALAVVIVTGSVIAALLIEGRRRDAEEARSIARAERGRAEEDMRFMLFDLRERLEPIGRLDLMSAVAERALGHYRAVGVGAATPSDDRTRAAALRAVGEVYEARGDLTKALESFEAALAASERSDAGPAKTPELALESALDRARRGGVLDAMGRRAEALAIFRRHVEEVEALAAASPGGSAVESARARAHAQLARALVRQSDLPGAKRAAARADEVASALSAQHPADPAVSDLRLEIELELAQIAAWAADWPAALSVATRVHDRAATLESDDPGDLRWSRRRADAIVRLLLPLARSGDFDGARRRFAEGQAILARESTADPTDERWAERSILLSLRMADAWTHAKKPASAVEELGPAWTTAKRLSERDPSNGRRLHMLVDVTDRRSAAYAALGDRERALAERRVNVEYAERLAARDPANSVWRLIRAFDGQRLAEAYEAVEDRVDAREAYVVAAGLLKTLAAEMPDDVAVRFGEAGTVLGEGRNRVRTGERTTGLARMREAVLLFDAAAARLPDSELPYRAAQAREELAWALDPKDPSERLEADRYLEEATGWAKGALAAKPDDFTASMIARMERKRADLRRD